MNRKELEQRRRENLNKLDRSFRPKINAVEIDINNSIKHELAKVICFWLIRKGVPANELQKCWEELWHYDYYDIFDLGEVEERCSRMIKKYGQKFKRKWQIPNVVTEARFMREDILIPEAKDRLALVVQFHYKKRADIFILDTGEIVEIETNKKIKKKGAITVYV